MTDDPEDIVELKDSRGGCQGLDVDVERAFLFKEL